MQAHDGYWLSILGSATRRMNSSFAAEMESADVQNSGNKRTTRLRIPLTHFTLGTYHE